MITIIFLAFIIWIQVWGQLLVTSDAILFRKCYFLLLNPFPPCACWLFPSITLAVFLYPYCHSLFFQRLTLLHFVRCFSLHIETVLTFPFAIFQLFTFIYCTNYEYLLIWPRKIKDSSFHVKSKNKLLVRCCHYSCKE